MRRESPEYEAILIGKGKDTYTVHDFTSALQATLLQSPKKKQVADLSSSEIVQRAQYRKCDSKIIDTLFGKIILRPFRLFPGIARVTWSSSFFLILSFPDFRTLSFSSRAFNVLIKAFFSTFTLTSSTSSSCIRRFESFKTLLGYPSQKLH